MEAKPINSSPPQTVYKTPDPQANVSELYSIYCVQMSNALSLEKSWVVNERYGAWDEGEPDPKKKKFKIDVKTLSPTDPQHYLTLDEAQEQANEQVILRVRNGFKYLFIHDFFDAPWYRRYEVFPDGQRREIPLGGQTDKEASPECPYVLCVSDSHPIWLPFPKPPETPARQSAWSPKEILRRPLLCLEDGHASLYTAQDGRWGSPQDVLQSLRPEEPVGWYVETGCEEWRCDLLIKFHTITPSTCTETELRDLLSRMFGNEAAKDLICGRGHVPNRARIVKIERLNRESL